MKTNTYIQYQGQEFQVKPIINKIKENWLHQGHKIKDLETLSLYIKPEDDAVYFVINDTTSGSLTIEELLSNQ